MKKIFFFILFSVVFMNLHGIESLTFKTKEQFSGNLVYKNNERVVFLMLATRFECKAADVDIINFKDSSDEFVIVLDDNSSVKGAIVDQDKDTYTIGSSMGLSPVDKKRVVEITNPKYADFKEPKKEYQLNFNTGVVPFADFILNDLGRFYMGASVRFFFESNLYTHAWIGLDAGALVYIPIIANLTDKLLLVPVNLTLKYEDNFYRTKNIAEWINNIFWYGKLGVGAAAIMYFQQNESTGATSVGLSMEAEYGIKYSLKGMLIGLSGLTSVILQKESYVLMQSAGFIIELRF